MLYSICLDHEGRNHMKGTVLEDQLHIEGIRKWVGSTEFKTGLSLILATTFEQNIKL